MKTAAAIVAAVFILVSCGCASTPERKIKNNSFLNAVGAVSVFAGMGAGAWAGAEIAGGNDASLVYGVIGGLAGAAAAGGIYWIIYNMIGEREQADTQGNTLPVDNQILMPVE